MSVNKSIKKQVMAVALIASVAALGAFVMNMDRNAAKTANIVKLEELNRKIASAPEHFQLSANQVNKQMIEGAWTVLKITNVEGADIFNKEEKDAHRSINVKLELIADSLIRIDNDPGQMFYISEMNGPKQILLYKEYNKGFEFVLLKKTDSETEEEVGVNDSGADFSNGAQKIKGLRLDKDVDLFLASALNPQLSKDILSGDHARGRVSIYGRNLVDLEVELMVGKAVRKLNVMSTDIKDGGIFNSGDEVSGIITNNGEVSYRIRIATGELKGTMLNFVTEDEYQRIRFQEEEAKRIQQEALDQAADKQNVNGQNQGQNVENQEGDGQNYSEPAPVQNLEDQPIVPAPAEEAPAEGNEPDDTSFEDGIMDQQTTAELQQSIREDGFNFGSNNRTIASKNETAPLK